jgi:hypothetical protein
MNEENSRKLINFRDETNQVLEPSGTEFITAGRCATLPQTVESFPLV